jgi:hypothetical protein
MRPRRLDEPDRGGRRRAAAPPPGRGQDRTGLYVGLGVGAGVLVLALAFAMSSSDKPEAGKVDRRADQSLKEDMEAAQKLAGNRKLAEALSALESAIQNPAYRQSSLLSKARLQADQYRKQIAFEREAAVAIDDFDRRITASKENKTAMKQADAFWKECHDLITKYGATANVVVLHRWREDLDRWRGTNAQGVWQDDYNQVKARIKKQHVDIGNYSQAVKEWRHFAQPFDSSDLRARVDSELVIINRLAKEDATKLVQGAGTGAKAKAIIEEAFDRFMETDGQQVLAQKLKTLN